VKEENLQRPEHDKYGYAYEEILILSAELPASKDDVSIPLSYDAEAYDNGRKMVPLVLALNLITGQYFVRKLLEICLPADIKPGSSPRPLRTSSSAFANAV